MRRLPAEACRAGGPDKRRLGYDFDKNSEVGYKIKMPIDKKCGNIRENRFIYKVNYVIRQESKAKVIKDFGISAQDTGSAQVQVAF